MACVRKPGADLAAQQWTVKRSVFLSDFAVAVAGASARLAGVPIAALPAFNSAEFGLPH